MKIYLLALLVLTVVTAGVGQQAPAPVINEIAPLNTAPQQSVVITGSGFSSTSSQLNVWFDHVKGTIISSSPFSIQVQVPPQARFSNVEVINLSNHLSGKSPLKFLPSFGGAQFDAAKTTKAFRDSLTNTTEFFDIASGDFDLDGKPDLVATKTNIGTPATDLVIYKNNSSAIGTVSFTKVDKATLPALDVSSTTANVSCGDLNGDGKPDIVATRVGATQNEVFILRNTNAVAGTLSFASVQKVLLDPGQSAFRVVIRDLNQDGRPELIVSNKFLDNVNLTADNVMYIFPNTSVAPLVSFATPIKLTVTGARTTYGLDVQDLDGDTRPDIVVNQFQSNNLYIFKNISTGNISFAPVQKITTTSTDAFNNVTSSDLNKDGLLDLVVTSTLENNMQIFINNSSSGNISFLTPQILTTSQGPWGVDVSDIDGDGDADIIVANKNEAKINVFRQDALLTFTRLDIVMGKPALNLRVGDYDGDGKPDIAVTSIANASYTLFSVDVIRNANCVSPLITSPSTTICTGQTVRLQTTPALGVTFNWKNSGGTSLQSSALEYYDATAADTYTVTATGTFDVGCAITSTGFTLTSTTGPAPASPVIGYTIPCLGGSLNLSTATVASATYQWTGPNNFSSALQNPTKSPVANIDAGIYTLQVTVPVGGGTCSSNIVTKLLDVASVPLLPVTASPSSTVCAGLTVNLAVSNVSGYLYQWNKNGTAVSGQTTSSLPASQEGDYSVVVTDNSTTCSQETAKTTVTILTAPVANFSFSSPQCKGVAVTFTDQTTADSRGSLVYSWNFGDSHTSAVQSPVNTYANAGSFNPSLTVNYSGVTGCSSSTSKPLTINTPVVPSITAGAPSLCVSESTSLSVAGTFSLFSWGGDNNLTGSTASVTVTQPGSYSVNTSDANACLASGSIVIGVTPTFTVVVSADTTIKAGDKAKLSASGGDSYLWSPGKTLSDSTVATPTALPSVTTSYGVTAKKLGFCSATDSVKITVEKRGKVITPPVLFSPNGDHINDSWMIPETGSYPDGTMTIYDGHGSQVYQQKGYNNVNAWDGTYNGKAVPDGTYFYVFSGANFTAATGSVLVVR